MLNSTPALLVAFKFVDGDDNPFAGHALALLAELTSPFDLKTIACYLPTPPQPTPQRFTTHLK
jgi:hypothetical protein